MITCPSTASGNIYLDIHLTGLLHTCISLNEKKTFPKMNLIVLTSKSGFWLIMTEGTAVFIADELCTIRTYCIEVNKQQ